jgi:AraC-like DNA-binding protein
MKIFQYSLPHFHLPVRTGFHSHPFWQFDWFFNTDSISVEFENETIKLSPEKLILIPPYIEHNVVVPGDSFTCGVKFDLEEKILDAHKPTLINRKDYKPVLDVIFGENIYNKETMAHLIKALLCMIKQNKNFLDEKEKLKDERILKALKFMRKNICANISRASISRHVNMSESHFAKLFREECGVSVIKKMRAMKIEKAAEMLEFSDDSISQIANMLAFSDLQTFSRFFYNEMRISPSFFRKKYSFKKKANVRQTSNS